jgi:hypothetical protein
MAANALKVNLRLKNFDQKRQDVLPTVKDALELFAPHLDGAELKVMLFIALRTLQFKKTQERISTSQLTHGVFVTDPETNKRVMVTQGTGKSKRQVLRAVKSLTEKGIITVGHPGGCPKKERPEEDYNVSLMESRKLMGLNFAWRPEDIRPFQDDFHLYVPAGKEPTPITCPKKPKKKAKKSAETRAAGPSITSENTAPSGNGGGATLAIGGDGESAIGGDVTLARTFNIRSKKKKKLNEEVILPIRLAGTGSTEDKGKKRGPKKEGQVDTPLQKCPSTSQSVFPGNPTEELIPTCDSASLEPATCSRGRLLRKINKFKVVEMKNNSDNNSSRDSTSKKDLSPSRQKPVPARSSAEQKEILFNISENVKTAVTNRLAERGAMRTKGSAARAARIAWDNAVEQAFPALPPHLWTVAEKAQMARLVEKAFPEDIDPADFFSTVIRNWATILEECVGVKYAANCPRTPNLLFLVKHINKFLPAYKRCVDPLAPKGSGSVRLRTEVTAAQAGLSQAQAQLAEKDQRISELETRVTELQQMLQTLRTSFAAHGPRAAVSYDGAAATRGGVPPAGLAHGGLAAFLAARDAREAREAREAKGEEGNE